MAREESQSYGIKVEEAVTKLMETLVKHGLNWPGINEGIEFPFRNATEMVFSLNAASTLAKTETDNLLTPITDLPKLANPLFKIGTQLKNSVPFSEPAKFNLNSINLLEGNLEILARDAEAGQMKNDLIEARSALLELKDTMPALPSRYRGKR